MILLLLVMKQDCEPLFNICCPRPSFGCMIGFWAAIALDISVFQYLFEIEISPYSSFGIFSYLLGSSCCPLFVVVFGRFSRMSHFDCYTHAFIYIYVYFKLNCKFLLAFTRIYMFFTCYMPSTSHIRFRWSFISSISICIKTLNSSVLREYVI